MGFEIQRREHDPDEDGNCWCSYDYKINGEYCRRCSDVGNERKLVIFTDGACRGNHKGSQSYRTAGWGYFVLNVYDEGLFYNCGQVELDTRSDHFIGADKLSNNSAELSAIVHALQFAFDAIQDQCPLLSLTLAADSEYAIKSITGEYSGKKANRYLIRAARDLIDDLRRAGVSVDYQQVPAHQGDWRNHIADTLAKIGADLKS